MFLTKGMNQMSKLNELMPGQRAFIKCCGSSKIKTRLIDLGAVEGTPVECVVKAPGGKTSAYMIRGAVIALRKCDAGCIEVFGGKKFPDLKGG